MFFLTALLTLTTITSLTAAQDLTFDSAAFNGSSNNVIIWTTPSQVEATNIDIGPPTLIINTWNVTADFLAVLSYNYTISSKPNETLIHWLWLQTDMTIAWASEYPSGQEVTGATLVDSPTTPPLVPYSNPQIPTSSTPTNLTIQIIQQTDALKSYLGQSSIDTRSSSSMETYLEKLSRFMNYDESVTSNANLMDTPRAIVYFSAVNSTAVDGDQESSASTSIKGAEEGKLDLSDPITLMNGSLKNSVTSAAAATRMVTNMFAPGLLPTGASGLAVVTIGALTTTIITNLLL